MGEEQWHVAERVVVVVVVVVGRSRRWRGDIV
jgi:hypothetical protein